MKKLPLILYIILALVVIGILVWDFAVDNLIDQGTQAKAIVVLVGLVISIVNLSRRSARKVSNKKALYSKAYAEYIENVFPEDKKLQKQFFDAVDDYNHGKPAAGVAKLEKLRPSCVRRSDIYAVTVFLALCLDEMKVYDKAAQQYRAALAIKPNSALASNLGLVLDRAGKEAEATAAYEQALRLDQGNANAWNNLAQQHLRNGRYEEALDAAGNAAKLNPKLAPAHNALAVSCYMLGDMEAYEQHYRRAVSNGSNGERLKAYIASLDPNL